MMDKLYSGAQKLGLTLTQQQLGQFETFFRELEEWNRNINLTAITGYEEVQLAHFLDSLTVTQAMPSSDGNMNVIDVGSGAGFPGMPLRILMPSLRLTLLEATGKKANFLKHLTGRLGLDEVEVIPGRAELIARMPQYRERFNLVLARAVAPLATLAELTLPFCSLGGAIIAQKKGEINREVAKAQGAITVLGGQLREVKEIELAEFNDARCLVVIDKVKPTPLEYPRRPGIPAKRPL